MAEWTEPSWQQLLAIWNGSPLGGSDAASNEAVGPRGASPAIDLIGAVGPAVHHGFPAGREAIEQHGARFGRERCTPAALEAGELLVDRACAGCFAGEARDVHRPHLRCHRSAHERHR